MFDVCKRVLALSVYSVIVAVGALVVGCDKKADSTKSAAKSSGHDHGHDHGDHGHDHAHGDHDHDHAHGDHDHGHDHAPLPKVTTVVELLTELRARDAAIKKQIDTGTIGKIHDDAYVITELAAAAGKTALADSAIARDRVRDINIAGKALADFADELHIIADKGDMPATKAKHAGLTALIDKVAGAAALSSAAGLEVGPYVCDMHCEPGKTSPTPAICPVCKMAFKPVSSVPYSVLATVESKVLESGKPVALKLQLIDRIGLPVKELDTVHEKILHLLTVSNDLSWYSHEHPVRRPDGSFAIELTFPHPGEFTIFADFTPTGDGQQVPSTPLLVPGKAPAAVTFKEDIDAVQSVDGYVFRLRCNGGPFVAGRDELMRYGVGFPPDGAKDVTDLEPYLGALGHLVIFSQDLKTFVHAHPLNDEVSASDKHEHGHDHAHHHHGQASPEELMAKAAKYGNGVPTDPVFHVVFPKPGIYRAFAQFQHKGKIITVANTIDVQPGDGESQPPAESEHKHDHDHKHDHGKPGGVS